MGIDRFCELNTLPVEKVSRYDRTVGQAYAAVQNDEELEAEVIMRVKIKRNAAKRVVISARIQSITQDIVTHDLGEMLDSQLVLEGEGLRSQDGPSPQWLDHRLGVPAGAGRGAG